MLGERLKKSKYTLFISSLIIILISFSSTLTSPICQAAEKKIWYVHDVIEPSSEEVRWREQGATEEAKPSIAAGLWFGMSKRESLVSAGDIFVSTYERLNWTRLAGALVDVYNLRFANFNDFVQYLLVNRLWWLTVTWDMNPARYGIFSNTTEVDYSF